MFNDVIPKKHNDYCLLKQGEKTTQAFCHSVIQILESCNNKNKYILNSR